MLLIHIVRLPEALEVSGFLWLFGLVRYLWLTFANGYLAVWLPGKYSFGQNVGDQVDLFIRCIVADETSKTEPG